MTDNEQDRSLRADVAEMVRALPQFARASDATRREAARELTRRIASASPDRPITVAEAREQLEGLAESQPKKGPTVARPGVLKVQSMRPIPGSSAAKTRVGRGDRSKGNRTARADTGAKTRYVVKVGYEGSQLPLHMRTPKLRGFKNPFRIEYQVVNLEKLAELYPKGGDVTVNDLVAKGAVRKKAKVKVLGTGDISVRLNVAVDKVAESAQRKIVDAGGSVASRESGAD